MESCKVYKNHKKTMVKPPRSLLRSLSSNTMCRVASPSSSSTSRAVAVAFSRKIRAESRSTSACGDNKSVIIVERTRCDPSLAFDGGWFDESWCCRRERLWERKLSFRVAWGFLITWSETLAPETALTTIEHSLSEIEAAHISLLLMICTTVPSYVL